MAGTVFALEKGVFCEEVFKDRLFFSHDPMGRVSGKALDSDSGVPVNLNIALFCYLMMNKGMDPAAAKHPIGEKQ